MQIRKHQVITLCALGITLVVGIYLGCTGQSLTSPAIASPTKALDEQDVYYPGSEDLGPNEMRVVACGTGMPNARPKQAA